ncbi:MAG: sulfite exporter TauE/SafE family protein [Allorhizobium sp.]
MAYFDTLPALLQTLFSGHSGRELLFLATAAFIGGLARGFSGFGGALIFMPLASSVIDPKLAAALLFLMDATTSFPLIPNALRRGNKREVGLMMVGAMVGVPVGTAILTSSDALTVRWSITILVIGLLALLISGWRYHGKPTAPMTIAVGAVSGLFGGAAQVGGPPVVAYWLGGVIPAVFVRANIMLYFALSTVLTGINYFVAGLLVPKALLLALVIAPGFGAGLFLGSRLFGIADERLFRRICFSLIAIAAVVGLPLLDSILR